MARLHHDLQGPAHPARPAPRPACPAQPDPPDNHPGHRLDTRNSSRLRSAHGTYLVEPFTPLRGRDLGGVLAAFALPALATAFGWRSTLLAGALVALSGAVAFIGFYRRPPGQRPIPTTSRVRLELLREPYMKKIILSGASMVSVHSGVGVLTVLYLHEVTSMDSAPAALVYVAVQCAGALGRICLAAWSDRHRSGRYACVLTCLTAVIIGMTALTTPIGRSPVAACLLFIWLGFFGIGWYGPWVAYAAESAPPAHTGFTLGLAMAVNQVAVILAPPVLGLLTDLTDSFTPAWALLAALTAAGMTATARL
ncbi:MFS transporter [Planomonospora sp. ID67723]|uniref:MFS transporter n=1 Tax=Planomonospora sp. ID67723 TaxID=2738134 RepID=UPI0021085ED5|nr:MFS transporter [Planomonospora sp. ID67723]